MLLGAGKGGFAPPEPRFASANPFYMEASALTHAGRRGLLPRRSPVLRLQGDERLVALIRSGQDRAFEALFDRYHGRLLAFCRSMLKSEQDAEDVLQEVFAAAHKAMLGDERQINVRPWLYRIARNRCLNHLRKPVADGQDTMDLHPHENGTTTDDRVQKREELRLLIADVQTLPETQRTALLLREIDALSYEEIAEAMDGTIPSVKSLLVRARITLAESTEARLLTCDDVRLELAEAAEGLRKASGPVRQHVRGCQECKDFRGQLRSDSKALAAIFPLGPIALLQAGLLAKLGIGGGAGSGAASGAAGGSAAVGGGAIGSGAAAGGTAGLGGLSSVGGAIGGALAGKAVAGVATAALLTAGAVEVSDRVGGQDGPAPTPIVAPAPEPEARTGGTRFDAAKNKHKSKVNTTSSKSEDAAAPAAAPLSTDQPVDDLTGGAAAGGLPVDDGTAGGSSDEDGHGGTIVPGVAPIVIVGTGGEGSGGGEGGSGEGGSGESGPGEGSEDPPPDPDTEDPCVEDPPDTSAEGGEIDPGVEIPEAVNESTDEDACVEDPESSAASGVEPELPATA